MRTLTACDVSDGCTANFQTVPQPEGHYDVLYFKVTQSLKLILSYALLQVQVCTLALEGSHGQLNYNKQGEDTQSWPFYTWSVVLLACTPVAENNTAAATMASRNRSSCVIKNNTNA